MYEDIQFDSIQFRIEVGKAKGRQLLGIIDNKFYRIVLIEVLGNGILSLAFCPDIVPRTCDILS